MQQKEQVASFFLTWLLLPLAIFLVSAKNVTVGFAFST
jgi:hypothetical protein